MWWQPLHSQLCCNRINPETVICCLMLQLGNFHLQSGWTTGALRHRSLRELIKKALFCCFDRGCMFQHQSSSRLTTSSAVVIQHHTMKDALPPHPPPQSILVCSNAILASAAEFSLIPSEVFLYLHI